MPVIADQYAWLPGQLAVSGIAIIAGAMGVRFLLQSVPLFDGVVVVKLLTVVLQESQYELLAELGEDKLMPSQVLVKIVGDYLKIRLALWEIEQVGRRGHG